MASVDDQWLDSENQLRKKLIVKGIFPLKKWDILVLMRTAGINILARN
jgi:hypothetical protein